MGYRVVMHHDHPVDGRMDIELDGIGALVERDGECGKRVLDPPMRRSAVRDEFGGAAPPGGWLFRGVGVSWHLDGEATDAPPPGQRRGTVNAAEKSASHPAPG